MRSLIALSSLLLTSIPALVLGQEIWGNQYPRSCPDSCLRTEIGVLGLFREQPDAQALAIDENQQELFNATELQGSMQFGLRVMLDLLHVSNHYGGVEAQVGYFGINSLDAETTITASQVDTIFFNSIPADPSPVGNISYSSNIYSAEANLRFRSDYQLRPLIGFRFFKLEDSFDTFLHGTGNISRIGGFSKTNNTMYGGQLGFELDQPLNSYWQIYSLWKLGLMGNDIQGAAEALDVSSNAVVRNYSDSAFSTLFEGGVGLEVCGPFSLRCGYHVLSASDVALGIDQNAAISLLTPDGTVAFNSQTWHGLNLTCLFEF